MVSVLAGPPLPTTISCLRRSSMVLIGDACQTMQTLTSSLALPIQVTLVGSNLAFTPISGSNGSARWPVAIAVPSLGAMPWMWPISRRPLAPGMFCTTTFGLPGMLRPEWRASIRA